MPYAVFESTNMRSTHYAERIFDCISDEAIENGTFGYLDGLATDESVVYNFKKGTKAGEPVIVADQPTWSEDSSRMTNQRRDKFIIPAGTKFRVRVVKKTDEFAISIEGVESASQANMAVDAFVTIDPTTGKLVASATSTAGAQMEGQVMRERIVGGTLSTNIRNYGYSTKLYEVKVTTLA